MRRPEGGGATALNGVSAVTAANDGLAQLCETTTALCGASGTTMRVARVTAHGANTKGGSKGANGADVRLLNRVRILCYFGDAYSGKNFPSTSTCPAAGYQERPEGTLVVEVMPPGVAGGQAGDAYGNTPSGLQRLLLVQ